MPSSTSFVSSPAPSRLAMSGLSCSITSASVAVPWGLLACIQYASGPSRRTASLSSTTSDLETPLARSQSSISAWTVSRYKLMRREGRRVPFLCTNARMVRSSGFVASLPMPGFSMASMIPETSASACWALVSSEELGDRKSSTARVHRRRNVWLCSGVIGSITNGSNGSPRGAESYPAIRDVTTKRLGLVDSPRPRARRNSSMALTTPVLWVRSSTSSRPSNKTTQPPWASRPDSHSSSPSMFAS